MNYEEHYNRLIDKARNRIINRNSDYYELHHIIPRSIGGSNESINLVYLTAKEHYIAHRLLTKIKVGLEKYKMIYALLAMSMKNKDTINRHTIPSRVYEYNKKMLIGTKNIWITNGDISLSISPFDDIPESFCRGRASKDMPSRKNLLSWTDGIINISAVISPGPTFRNGVTKNTSTAHRPWWNDGAVNKRTVECPGDGFISGRLKWKSKIVICPHCEKSGGETAMKQHHFDHCKHKKD